MKRGWLVFLLLLLLCAMTMVSLVAGRVWLPLGELWNAFSETGSPLARVILLDLRLPRAVLAILVGATLGVSGAVLQGLTRNPLAEPGLLGVSSGASLGAVISLYFGFASAFAVATPLFGLIGALSAAALTFSLGWGGGTLPLILAGAAVTGLASALISLAINLAPNPYAAYEIMTWLMGSLQDRSWDQVYLVAPFIACGVGMLAFTGRSLDALSLGEAQAQSLGVDLMRLRILALLGTALAVGAATSISGAVGFVGLVGPHLVRPLVGHQPSRVLLPAALAGAVLLLGADMATRLIRFGAEMKLGVFTSLIGTPFFFWLVVRLRKTSP